MKKMKKWISGFDSYSIYTILILGAYLRLWRIREYMTFLGDEGRDVMVVRKMITELDITFLGPTASVGGFFLGPAYYYFMTPFLLLFGMDPVGPAVMVALFGVLTIYLVYVCGRVFFNATTGLLAALIYALSPLVIRFSRTSWNPNILPFFSLLYILSLYNAVKTKHTAWFFLAGVCFGIGIQLHYLYAFLVPVGIIYILLYCRSLRWIWQYVFAVFGALSALLPFLAFELKNRFPNTTSIVRFILEGQDVSASGDPFSIVSDVVFRLFGRLVFFFPPSEQITINMFNGYWWWQFGIVVVIAGSVGHLAYQVYKKRQKKHVLLVLWFIFGTGLFSFYQREIYDYYFTIMFALPFLLTAYLAVSLLSHRYVKYAVIGLIAWLVFFNWQGRPFVHEPNNQIGNVERIAREVYDATGGEPYNFALLTSGNSDHAYRYFLEMWDHAPTVIHNPDIDPTRSSVTNQLIVLCEYSTCQPLGNPLWEIAGFGPAEIESIEDIGLGMRVYRLVHASF